MKNELLTLSEVASILRLSNSTVYKLINTLNLPALKVANKWRVKTEYLDEWMEKQSSKNFK